MECKICNKYLKSEHALKCHLRLNHNINYVEYNVKYNRFKIPKCPICGNDRSYRGSLKYNNTCNCIECKKEYASIINKKSMTNETKEKISNSMKKAHFEGKAWNIGKSRWNNEPSYPEKLFMKIIQNEFDDKIYVREHNVGIYSIDFAWVHKKLAIEIDGEQHYRFDKYKNRDIKKDKFLSDNGWKILRIKWDNFCNNTKYYIDYCNNFINNKDIVIDEQLIEVDYELLKTILNKGKCKKIITSQQYIEDKKLQILKSNIKFNKRGWIKEVSKILNISPQKVTPWMKKNMFEFWDKNCLKRNRTKT